MNPINREIKGFFDKLPGKVRIPHSNFGRNSHIFKSKELKSDCQIYAKTACVKCEKLIFDDLNNVYSCKS